MKIETLKEDEFKDLAQKVNDHLMGWADFWMQFRTLHNRWIITAYRADTEKYRLEICDAKKLKKEIEKIREMDLDFDNEENIISEAYYHSLKEVK